MSDHTYSNGTHTWLVHDLWTAAESLPIEQVPVASLAHHLDEWSWEPGDITPRIVAQHALRMAQAGDYPILLTPDGWIADGMHRLAWAWVNGAETIAVQRFGVMPVVMPATDQTEGK